MSKIRKTLSSKIFIHAMVLLGLFALWGFVETNNSYILLGMAASFSGAACGSFIRVIDKIGENNANNL